ncbi:hypothetical protein [uncultured Aquimarina sp.]|uniref:hypothetical protein n=1 Tax=uncultured Aquimarina sp. TaxID=575652 RepID=UPI00260FC58C|nr:hypothetical protein [uncultured Aquimarina sp.]
MRSYYILFLIIVFSTLQLQSQIETAVITIDLSEPFDGSVEISNDKKRLSFDSRQLLSFELKNGNPLRYKYVLNYKEVDLFKDPYYTNALSDGALRLTLDNYEIPKKDSTVVDRDSMALKSMKGYRNKTLKLVKEINSFYNRKQKDEVLDLLEFKEKLLEYKEGLEFSLFEVGLLEMEMSPENKYYEEFYTTYQQFQSASEEVKKKIAKMEAINETTYLLPIDINGSNIDYVEVKLEITDLINSTTEERIYKVWINGGLKIDFSGGFTVTSLFDREYRVSTVLDDPNTPEDESGSLINEIDQGDYNLGFGVFTNISLRTGGSWVKPSLNIGVILDSQQKFQFLTGLGIILGKNQRFIIQGGITMGRVTTLSEGFKADGETKYDLGENGNLPTNEKFEFGHFFGVSYNFAKPKAKKPE